MKLRPLTLAVLALVASLSLAAHAQEVRRPYIIQLADKPVASYTGEVSGYKATKPGAGRQLDVGAAAVQAYLGYLEHKQNNVLAAVSGAQLIHQYKVVFNGFSAMLTDAEVRQLKKQADVAAISADEEREPLTNYTPAFLGLDKVPNGLWSQLGGKGNAGDGIVIGIVDGGVWPENGAFADRVDANGAPTFDPSGTLAYGAPPAAWQGSCETGEGFTASHCNNKLIGARYFNTSFIASGRTRHWTEFVSPRDSVGGAEGHGGHGTHTATTAGGNHGVQSNVNGVPMGAASGIAPRARIASYKVCWTYVEPTNPDGSGSRNSCFNGDSVAAIERAVLDGVNVINYSISGSQTSVADPVEQAFFGAANAGVFVAASAGNSGPANAVAHLSPWVTTVAASTHNRLNGATATLGNNASYTGASLNQNALPATSTILAADAGLVPYADLDATDKAARRLCFTAADRASFGGSPAAALDAALATGKVLVCDRGSNARVAKSEAAAAVGAVGMILADNGAGLVAEIHSVPTVHISAADGAAVKAYVAGNAGATAAISTFSAQVGTALAPKMAGFSSRGPNKGNANVLKPDLTAPGVDILAGVTPAKTAAERDAIASGAAVPEAAWAFYQGTSMSSPHVAGLAALLKHRHPSWSPAAIKSALMTTGATTYNDGLAGMQNGLLPWAQGAGHVTPNLAQDPGLVYELGTADYQRFLCGLASPAVSAATCQSVGSIQAYNLNLPSLTASNVLGKLTLTRTVTNVGSTSATYTASASLPGFTVAVSPASLTLAPGASASYSVKLTNVSAPNETWQYGALEWTDGVHRVRSPLTARATLLAASPTLYSEASNGNIVYTIGTGFTGRLGSLKGGLKPALRSAQTVGQTAAADGGVAECKAGGSAGVTATSVTIPAGTMVARFALYDVDTSGYQGGALDDLDLIVVNGAGTQVGYSGGSSSNELVSLLNPAPGSYRVCVAGYAPVNGSSNYTLSSWVVGGSDMGGGFKAVMPGYVISGGSATAGVSWHGLTDGVRYIGAVQYLVGGVVQGSTVVEVDATDPVPANTAARSKAPQAN